MAHSDRKEAKSLRDDADDTQAVEAGEADDIRRIDGRPLELQEDGILTSYDDPVDDSTWAAIDVKDGFSVDRAPVTRGLDEDEPALAPKIKSVKTDLFSF